MNAAMKKIIAESAAGLLICGAGHYFVARPAAAKLAETRREVSTLVAQGVGARTGPTLSVEQLEGLLRATGESASSIERRGEPARDETAMFAAVMALGTRCEVQIDQMQPVAAQAAAPGAAPAPAVGAPADKPGPADTTIRYTLSVTGSYGNTARFVDALRREVGYTVVSGVHVAPDSRKSGSVVHTTIETRHHAFDVSAVESMIRAAPSAEGGTGP